MSAAVGEKDDAARAGLEQWHEHAEESVDADFWACFCQSCGACVRVCPAAKFGVGYDPRELVLKVRYGMAGELLVKDSVLWQCFKCYRCHDACPQPIKPEQLLSELRKLLPKVVRGVVPVEDDEVR